MEPRYVQHDAIVERRIHGTWYLIDIADRYEEDRAHLVRLNDSGYLAWNALTKPRCASEIAAELVRSSDGDVTYREALKDAKGFVGSLLAKGLIITCCQAP